MAINQADMAMMGKYWNYEEHRPEPRLEEFLVKNAESVKNRIFEATGVSVEPICYNAGYTEDGVQEPPYNLNKLLMLARTLAALSAACSVEFTSGRAAPPCPPFSGNPFSGVIDISAAL